MSALSAVPSVTDLASASSGSKSPTAVSNEESGDRFLKLLVTQLKNQDPMNPMDNAQLTSQMAQINTVAGIEKLNNSVASMTDKLSTQLAALNPSGGLDKLEATLQKMSGQFLQAHGGLRTSWSGRWGHRGGAVACGPRRRSDGHGCTGVRSSGLPVARP